MSQNFLHGVEVIEVDDGTRPIQTVRSSVIGLVGTAPDAGIATAASASAGGVLFLAESAGALGNNISVYIFTEGGVSDTLAINVDGRAITIRLATDAAGEPTTTVTDLVAEINGDAAASALVYADGTGSAIVGTTIRPVFLSGGEDEPFPLNKPVLVAGNRRLAGKLGNTGTLPAAMDAIFAQTGAVVVVVRVEQVNGVESTIPDEVETLTNVAGGYDSGSGAYTGAWAFLGAESAVGFCPKILIAPGWTHQYTDGAKNPVMAQFETIAARLRAVAIGDSDAPTIAQAQAQRGLYGSKRVYLHNVFYKVQTANGIVDRPASGYLAGMIARVDNDEGFWVSPSNHEIFGIVGTSRPIDFTLGESTSEANLLNELDIATTIRKDGFRLWGNRTCSFDAKWAFLSVVRTADMINESILRAHMWAVDRNITRTYVKDVVGSVKLYLSRLINQGAIAGGDCWADPDANPPDQIAAGQIVFDFDFSAYAPAERVTFRSRLTNDYLEEII